jgi:hypothetical protein
MSSYAFGDTFAVRSKAKRRMGILRPGSDFVVLDQVVTSSHLVKRVFSIFLLFFFVHNSLQAYQDVQGKL